MARFVHQSKSHIVRRAVISMLCFALAAGTFLYGTNSLSEGNVSRQRQTLENALTRTVSLCYAVEGSYPESLDYMKDYYGLTFDEDLFYVDYKVSGSNLYPDITIIEKGGNYHAETIRQ